MSRHAEQWHPLRDAWSSRRDDSHGHCPPFSVASAQDGRRIANGGVSLTIPSEWQSLQLSPVPPGTKGGDPVTRLVTASSAVRFGRGCNDIDYAIEPKAVAIIVFEWRSPTPGAKWKVRPSHFTNTNLPIKKGAVECWAGAGGSVQFAQSGRRFAAFLLARQGAPTSSVWRAREDPRFSTSGVALRGMREWWLRSRSNRGTYASGSR